ncbi:hypothetical protein [Lichenifustis flavocetrariae]|uniref:hypothetical protein n=1 Tax=Lichenifustis flavocetrariae TaxID=2949735 RepID=UPI003D11D270
MTVEVGWSPLHGGADRNIYADSNVDETACRPFTGRGSKLMHIGKLLAQRRRPFTGARIET